ncbi:phenylacetate--CoA ligase family protein [Plantactinospora sp. BB1]|uniref:phenylacetate--CoA ligase family protein n=1 Tax=Plantactinospora sp. BB1 TaxID=2071627 RepID=UPI000D171914|nr:AMP-binding protein [Plantactinospora sp. BB1]
MLETAWATLRFGTSMVFNRPFHRRSLDRIMTAMRATYEELGPITSAGGDMLGGPSLDEETRKVVQSRRFREQAVRAARETSYYAEVFQRTGLDPRRIQFDDIASVPVTPKEALRDDPEAFVRSGARPHHRSTTTGTTGWPTTVWFSDDEYHLIGVLSAITFLNREIITPEDFVQVSISTRARLGVHGVSFAAGAIGAVMHAAGLVSPEHTLALLSERHRLPRHKPYVSVMSTYPSYLGQLIEAAREGNYQPNDFGLERILMGGEIITAGLERRAQEVFGPITLLQNYGMTELMPFGANLCNQAHLHYEPAVGLAEFLDLEGTGRPVGADEPGVVVATPLPPFRDTTVLLRYNTEDVVRPVTGPLTCDMRRIPASTNLLGKLKLAVRHDDGWVFVRDVVEALDSVDAVVLPARYGFWAVPGGVAVEVVARSDDAATREAIGTALEERGVPLRDLRVITDRADLQHPRPLRCDLREGSMAKLAEKPKAPTRKPVAQPALAGVNGRP